MMTDSVPPSAFQDFPSEEGWNVTLEVSVTLHIYDKFYHLWRSGGYQNATDYITHMLLMEEHSQNGFRDLNESGPQKEDRLTMELSRQLLDIAESAKQQESPPSATSSSPMDHEEPSSPLRGATPRESSPVQVLDNSPVPVLVEAQVPAQVPAVVVSYASLQGQQQSQHCISIAPSMTSPTPSDQTSPAHDTPTHSTVHSSTHNSTGEHCMPPERSNDPDLHNNSHFFQSMTSMIQQAKMSDLPPLIPMSALVTPGHLDQGYLVNHPSSKKSPHNRLLHPITDDGLMEIKPDPNGPSHVPPNSPCGPNTPMPMLQKLPGIGELYKPISHHTDNGFRTSPDHLVSPGGFNPSPMMEPPSAPEVSSSCDSTTSRRPIRQKAEEARQFIQSLCSPDSFEEIERQVNSNMSFDDLDDESDYSDSEDANNNSVRRKICKTECETCQEIFLSDEYLMQHYMDNPGHQRSPMNSLMTCELCNQPVEGRQGKIQHYQDHHPEFYRKKVQKLCSLCNLILPNKHALRQHLKSHEPDLTLCPEKGCGYLVKRQHIAQHMTKTHGESQVTCDECGKVFRNVLALKAHTQNVHKGFKYVCSFNGCHRSFKRPSTLKVHELIHKDFKPMKCKLCSFRCRQQASISHHFKQHHPGVKPGFVRQSEAQIQEERMLSPSKHSPYSPQDIQSPVKNYMTPSPEMSPSPEMISNNQYRMALGLSQLSAEVC